MTTETTDRLIASIDESVAAGQQTAIARQMAEITLRMIRDGLPWREQELKFGVPEETLTPWEMNKVSARLVQAHGQLHPEDS